MYVIDYWNDCDFKSSNKKGMIFIKIYLLEWVALSTIYTLSGDDEKS